jgi:hypothetical protein
LTFTTCGVPPTLITAECSAVSVALVEVRSRFLGGGSASDASGATIWLHRTNSAKTATWPDLFMATSILRGWICAVRHEVYRGGGAMGSPVVAN